MSSRCRGRRAPTAVVHRSQYNPSDSDALVVRKKRSNHTLAWYEQVATKKLTRLPGFARKIRVPTAKIRPAAIRAVIITLP
jgi:hypothetical protein